MIFSLSFITEFIFIKNEEKKTNVIPLVDDEKLIV